MKIGRLLQSILHTALGLCKSVMISKVPEPMSFLRFATTMAISPHERRFADEKDLAMLRLLGFGLLIAGAIWVVVAFNMETSVPTGLLGTSRVQNIGLIAERQNHLLVASLITMIGAILAIFGGARHTDERQSSALDVKRELQPPCERDLTLDPYRLWLAERYDIKNNELFKGFTFDGNIFPSLDEALSSAHAIENQKESERLKNKNAASDEIGLIVPIILFVIISINIYLFIVL